MIIPITVIQHLIRLDLYKNSFLTQTLEKEDSVNRRDSSLSSVRNFTEYKVVNTVYHN